MGHEVVANEDCIRKTDDHIDLADLAAQPDCEHRLEPIGPKVYVGLLAVCMERVVLYRVDKRMMDLGMSYVHKLSLERQVASIVPGICADTGPHTPRPNPCFPVILAKDDGGVGDGRTLVLGQSDALLSVGGLLMWKADGLGCESWYDKMFDFERLSQMASIHLDRAGSSIHRMDRDTHGFQVRKVARPALPMNLLRR